jgi:hypothetical protein
VHKQEGPKITAEKFIIGDNKVYGTANIQHWKNKGVEEGLFFHTPQQTYVQCATAMPAIRAAIAELPHKEYYAQKLERKINADGDICTVQKWAFGRRLKTEKDTYITDSEMGLYLDSKGITKIEITDAVKMWADEKEAARIKANEAGNAKAKWAFEADVGEVGHNQACENAGIPIGMR